MSLSAISAPYPFPVIDISWPAANKIYGNADAFQNQGTWRNGGVAANAVFDAAVGAATNNMLIYKTILAAQFTSTAVTTVSRSMSGIACQPMLTAPAGAVSTMQMPEHIRCYGYSFLFTQVTAAAYTSLSGIALQPSSGTPPGWIDAGNRGIGIVGDGAGGWRYVEKNAGGVGVYQTSTALTWPVAVTEWARVDFVLLNATAVAAAGYEVWINNVRVVSNTFGVGNAPTYAQGPANAASWVPQISCGDALVGSIGITALRYTVGKYHPVTGNQIGT